MKGRFDFGSAEASRISSVRLLFEAGRSVGVNASVFEDDFDEMGVHVYEICPCKSSRRPFAATHWFVHLLPSEFVGCFQTYMQGSHAGLPLAEMGFLLIPAVFYHGDVGSSCFEMSSNCILKS